MPSPKNFTYNHFLELMADSTGHKMEMESSTLVERFQKGIVVRSGFAPTTFLLDYQTRKYIYMGEACINLAGYTPTHYYESGLDEYLKSMHPADFRIMNERIFPDNLHFLGSLPREKYSDIIFSYNYRLLNATGEYVQLLQRFSYIPGNSEFNPLGVVGVAFNITHFKNDPSIVHTIEESSCQNEYIPRLLLKKVYPTIDYVDLGLTSREMQILKEMAGGLSSKQIADRLHISIHTINNHRKSMLTKTNCGSSAELIGYAAKYGLL